MFGVGILSCVLLISCASAYLHSHEVRKAKREIIDPSLIVDDEHIIEDEEIQEHLRYSPEKVNLIKCKQYHQVSKVVRGRNAKPREFPHMALLGYEKQGNISWDCGGSLISEKFVLTAVHCLRSNGKPVKYVRLGDLDIKSNTDDAQPQEFTVKKLYIHPSFKSPNRYHDIALIQLDRKVKFTKYVIPACVGLTADLAGTTPEVAGWGLVRKGGNPANILQTAPMAYSSTERCSKTFQRSISLPRGIDEDFIICAGGGTNTTDTCQGDSGGPLQIINNSYDFGSFPEIVGITSMGKSCGYLPGIYTRVYPYTQWIEETVWSYLWKSPATKT